MVNYIIIGGGWRAEFYLDIARRLPEEFNAVAVCIRNPEKAEYIKNKYGVKVCLSVDEVLKEDFDFVVSSINYDDVSDMAVSLADKGYYVLCETPVLSAPDKTTDYEKIQIAEQYHQRGTYQALKKLIDTGIIGDITHINISVAHDYHGMSVIRFLLDDYSEPEKLGEFDFKDTLLMSHGRDGEIEDKYYKNADQKIIVYKFGTVSVVYDFNHEQYFTPIRKDRILIRGSKGEISNDTVRYFDDNGKFVESKIKTELSGMLYGFYNDRITFEGRVLYEYPFNGARLSEEELAIGECLRGMKEYIETGREFYSYKRGYEDMAFFKK